MKPPRQEAALAAAETGPILSGWRYRAAVGAVILAAVCYLGFALWSGWQDVASAVGRVGVLGTVAVLSLSLVNYGLRFIRWQAYLEAMGHPMPWGRSFKIYLSGFALTVTPGKAGEALRGVLLKDWGVPYPKSLAAFLSERLSDLVAVVLLTLFGLAAYPAAQPLVATGIAGILGVLVVISNQNLLERISGTLRGGARFSSLLQNLIHVFLQARRCHAPWLLGGATGLSIVAWAAEAWGFYLILAWMDANVTLSFAIFVYAISMLAGALSFLPGGLGGAEIVMISLLVWAGVDNPQAIAATLLIRFATLWFAVALGAIALFVQATPSSSHGVRRGS